MAETEKSTAFLNDLTRSLSKARIKSYNLHGESDRIALGRYVWNLLLCESLYPGFQILEVSFRNAVHLEISKTSTDACWLNSEIGFLYPGEIEAIKKSKNTLMERRGSATEDYLVAEMSFGFWTSLLDSRYETMWPKIIKGVFPNMPNSIRTRKEASKLINTVRKLRNAALHHHSIWHWSDLKDQHEKMTAIIGYVCQPSGRLLSKIDRFPKIYAGGYQAFDGAVAELMESADRKG